MDFGDETFMVSKKRRNNEREPDEHKTSTNKNTVGVSFSRFLETVVLMCSPGVDVLSHSEINQALAYMRIDMHDRVAGQKKSAQAKSAHFWDDRELMTGKFKKNEVVARIMDHLADQYDGRIGSDPPTGGFPRVGDQVVELQPVARNVRILSVEPFVSASAGATPLLYGFIRGLLGLNCRVCGRYEVGIYLLCSPYPRCFLAMFLPLFGVI